MNGLLGYDVPIRYGIIYKGWTDESYLGEWKYGENRFAVTDSLHFSFGATASFRLTNMFYLNPEINFYFRNSIVGLSSPYYGPDHGFAIDGANSARPTTRIDLSETGIGIPIMVRAQMYLSYFGVYAEAGIQADIPFGTQWKLPSAPRRDFKDFPDRSGVDIGIPLGFGTLWGSRNNPYAIFGVRFNIGITSFDKNGEYNSPFRTEVFLGYMR